MKVTLLSHTPDPERTVAASAKLCYSPAQIDTILEGLTPEKTAGFVEMLGSIGHESPIEHINFTFGIEGVSRALLAQLTRHRIASYSVQSQRYVPEGDFEYITPPQISQEPEALAIFEQVMAQAEESYQKLVKILAQKEKVRLMAQGKEEKAAAREAEKTAIEDARFVLPNACATKMIVTMNARSLKNFFRHRCCLRAQWEIRFLAEEMLRLCQQVAPHLFIKSGPACVSGPCTEGKMNCGQIVEVRRRYASGLTGE